MYSNILQIIQINDIDRELYLNNDITKIEFQSLDNVSVLKVNLNKCIKGIVSPKTFKYLNE